MRFPISRDPPEGGTAFAGAASSDHKDCFQFLGIPPKGELTMKYTKEQIIRSEFPISRDPPEGGTFLASSAAFRAVCVSNF